MSDIMWWILLIWISPVRYYWENQEVFYPCKISFPRFFVLNTVAQCLFRTVEYGSNVLSRCRSFNQGGWDLRCWGFRTAIREAVLQGWLLSWIHSSYLSLIVEYPSKDLVSVARLEARYLGICKTLTLHTRRMHFAAPGSHLCFFHLTERLRLLSVSFRDWLCQSMFSSCLQKRMSFILKRPK